MHEPSTKSYENVWACEIMIMQLQVLDAFYTQWMNIFQMHSQNHELESNLFHMIMWTFFFFFLEKNDNALKLRNIG